MTKDLKHLLSKEAQGRRPSPLKSAFKYYHDDKIVFLGGGLPMADYFPWDKITATSPAPAFEQGIAATPEQTGKSTVTELKKTKLEEYDVPLARSLQYGYTDGQPELMEFIKEHTKIVHHPPYEDWDSIATVGNTESWDSTLRTFCDPKDYILVEEYTFSSAIETAHALDVQFAPVGLDEFGIIPEKLDAILSNWDSSKPKPKLLYTICTGQNPTGSSLSAERRVEIYKLACKHDFLIVEDEPYYFLQMDKYDPAVDASTAPAPKHDAFLASLVKSFLSLDTEGRVIRLDSFSKVLAPGTRLGWITCQKPLLERYLRLHEVSIQTPSGFTQSICNGLLQRWGQDGYIDWLIGLRKEYTIKRDFTMKALAKSMPAAVTSYFPPVAGMFFTVQIDAAKHPDFASKYDSDPIKVETAVYEQALKEGSLMIPGSWFQSPNFEPSGTTFFFRGTYAAVPLDQLAIGLERFGAAIKKEFQL